MYRANTCVAFAAWLLIASVPALAQTAGGSIAGTVRDTTGALLPGVTVEASSPALIEKVRTAVTDGGGQYRIVDLRPGSYAVTFTLPGFSTVKREGIELTTGFTAPLNAELRVGDVSETLTVTGEAPTVDIQNTQRQVVMTRDLIDTVPTARNWSGLGVLIPGMVLSNSRGAGNSGQEVGGSTGVMATFNTGLMIHGGRRSDQQLQVDGMPLITWTSIQAPSNMTADGNYQEVVLNVSGNAAEIESSGVRINLIPREGSNSFTGRLFATASHQKLQANNLTDTLKQQGLQDPNRLKTLWQYNPSAGGPVVRDYLWFFASFTQQRNENYLAGTYANANLGGWQYQPDRTRQAFELQEGYDYAFRGTWQATRRNKISAFYDFNKICVCTLPSSSAGAERTSPEATTRYGRKSPLLQVSWSAPVTNRLLFEAGMSQGMFPTDNFSQPDAVGPQIVDTGLGVAYGNTEPGKLTQFKMTNFATRGSVSYVTGTHSLKVGYRSLTGSFPRLKDGFYQKEYPGGITFETLNGVPTSVTYYGTPLVQEHYMRPMLGLYGQDQWTLQRLTMNLGVRYDYFRTGYPDQSIAPTQWTPFIRSVEGRVVVRWHDVSPRLGLSYDLFGNARTALKVSAGRYVLADGLSRARDTNPIGANNTNTRRWTDANGDRVVQGDPFNVAANAELGPSTNLRFGQPASSLEYDPDWAFGFGQRPGNWEFSAGVQHELLPRVSVTAAYFRRAYTNFEVTHNRALVPGDFDPYCVTTPIDSRLPGGGGQQICGLHDLKPNKVGQLQQVRTSGSAFGQQYEHWNGVDLTIAARFPKLLLQGGLSAGKTTADNCAVTTSHPEVVATAPAGALWLTSGPSTPTQFCHVETPLAAETQVKLLGSYTLPWDVVVSGTFQNLPGPPIVATATYTSAQIASSLGRPLAGASTARVNIVPPNTLFSDRLTQIDLRLAKGFSVQGVRLQGMVDLYNAFNDNVVTLQSSTYGATTGSAAGATWLTPRAILPARLIKLGVQFEF